MNTMKTLDRLISQQPFILSTKKPLSPVEILCLLCVDDKRVREAS